MTTPSIPVLAGDFSLIPVPERLLWRDALAHHILDQLNLSEWKKQEQIEPMNLTITCLIEAGMTDAQAIAQHIIQKNYNRNPDASSN